MKIELTKEEWEFLHRILTYTDLFYVPTTKLEDLDKSKSIYEKLDNEWVDND